MLSQSNPFSQLRCFVQAGMFVEAITAYSALREGATRDSGLIADEVFQRELGEAEYSLARIVRQQIEEIHDLMERGRTEHAFARGMQLAEILDVEPTRRYFTQYLHELHDLLGQLNNERSAEQGFHKVQRLVEHHEFDKALRQLSLLREEVYPRARIRREIEQLYDELRGITNVTLTPVKRDVPVAAPQAKLTAQYLERDVAPFLNAIVEIQRLLDRLLERETREVAIRVISQNSPIGVSLEGVSDTFLAVTDLLIPWKRKHAEKMAEYARREKQYEIEKKRIELHEANLQLAKSQQEIEKSSAEVAKLREEAEKLRIENERARMELGNAKIQFALDILAKVAPNLSETDKLSSLVRLLPLLDTVVASDIEIARK